MNNLENDSDILKNKEELENLQKLNKELRNELITEQYKHDEIIKYNKYLKNKYNETETELRKSYNKELQNKINLLEYQIKNLED